MRIKNDAIQFENRREIEDVMLALEEVIPKTREEKSRTSLKTLQEKLYALYISW